MAEVSLSKTYQIVGIAAAIATVYYIYKTSKGGNATTRTIGGVKFTKVNQPNRDARLGQPGQDRKYFGSRTTSSATGAGAAAGLPPHINRLSSPTVQTPSVPVQRPNRMKPLYQSNTSKRANVAVALGPNAW
jgi:hypothetical protein